MSMPMLDEEAIFQVARRIETAEAREVYLRQTCGTEPALRARVEALLRVHDEARSFLESPPEGIRAPAEEPTMEGPGTVIGPYKLLEKIGEGGFGIVFMAEQQHPVRRRVALKVIKPGMDTRQVIARFEAERQALALMEHPNIAHVLDGGATASGRPYFVMELVRGVPITEFCDQKRLPVRQRLELFLSICHAVQHAHQKGIIHRDIKPSNVLVTLHDGTPVVKVIDFGVAKAMGQRLTDKTLFTNFVQMVGTPLYMSPEQAELSGLDIDTRSDIYSLGVLLYELLTGTTPFDRERLKTAAFDEIRRIIREEEPAKPSTRISTIGAAATTASGNRQTDPQCLSRLLRGELDWIVMKCLEKDRTRRYETANGLALDVQRYLADEPVLAGPPSPAYWLRKFVRRNRGPVLAATVIFSLLVAGVVGTTVGLIRADGARREAETSAQLERLAKQQAERRLAQIEKGVELFAGLLKGLNPQGEGRDGPPLYEQLRQRAVKAADELVGEAVGDPEAVARLQTLLGLTLLGLGDTSKATELLERARATLQARLGPDHHDTLTTLSNLATAYHLAGRWSEAVALFEQVRDARLKKPGADHSETLITLNNLASAYLAADKLPEAIALYEQIHDIQVKTLGADHPDTLGVLHNVAVAYWHSGKLPLAVNLLEQVRDARVQKLGADHFDTLATRSSLAAAYQAAGKLTEAIALFEEVRGAQEKKLGADHFSTLTTLHYLAAAYRAAGKLPEAIALFGQVRDARVKTLGADHPDTLATLSGLAAAYRDAGKLPEAVALFEQVRSTQTQKLGADHRETLATLYHLAWAYRDAGKLPEAVALFEQVRDAFVKKLGADHPDTLKTLSHLTSALAVLGANLLKQKKWTEAEATLMNCLAIRRKTGPDDWLTFHTTFMLGMALSGQKRYAEAEPLLLQGYEGMKAREAMVPQAAQTRVTEAGKLLVQLYEAWGKPEQAAAWRKRLAERETPPRP